MLQVAWERKTTCTQIQGMLFAIYPLEPFFDQVTEEGKLCIFSGIYVCELYCILTSVYNSFFLVY
jgi:hypothetical protein